MNLNELKKEVDNYFGVDISERNRKNHYVFARFSFCHLAYKYCKGYHTYREVGEVIDRDHSSVIYSLREFYNVYDYDKNFQIKFNELEEEIKSKCKIIDKIEKPLEKIDYRARVEYLQQKIRNKDKQIYRLKKKLQMIEN